MIKFASIPHSDSVFLSAVAVARVLRAAGHEFRIALDESAPSFLLIRKLAEQLGEDLVSMNVLVREPPDVVLFESSYIAPHAFKDVFRINFPPGVFANQRFFLYRMNAFALGNFVFSPNYVSPDILDVFGGSIPVLGLPAAELFPTASEGKSIVYPDSFPMTRRGRKVWFTILEKIAKANPDYSLIIKERFSKDFFGHFPFPSFSEFFSDTTPDSIRIAAFNEDTRGLLAQASYVVGITSGILVEAALNGKRVCLIDSDFPEKNLGRALGKDWFYENGLRVETDIASEKLAESCLLTRESLVDFVPSCFASSWFIEVIEGIFKYFPDRELRNSLKFDLDVNLPIEIQLKQILHRAESPEQERAKNLARYEYSVTVSQAALMINLIAPDFSTIELTTLIKKYIVPYVGEEGLEYARSHMQNCLHSLAEFVASELYRPDKLNYILGPEMLYETPFLLPGFHVSDALERIGKRVSGEALANKIYECISKLEENVLASYVNAVALKRMGKIRIATDFFYKVINTVKVEKNLKAGAFFHLGDLSMQTENYSEAKVLFEKCLVVEPNHCKARELLNVLTTVS